MLLQVIRILLDIGVWLLLLSFIFAKYFDKAERKDEDKLSREDVYDIVNKIDTIKLEHNSGNQNNKKKNKSS